MASDAIVDVSRPELEKALTFLLRSRTSARFQAVYSDGDLTLTRGPNTVQLEAAGFWPGVARFRLKREIIKSLPFLKSPGGLIRLRVEKPKLIIGELVTRCSWSGDPNVLGRAITLRAASSREGATVKQTESTGAPPGAEAPTEVPERWSAQRKAEVVLRLLRGEPLDAVAQDTQVPTHELEAWRRVFLDGGTQRLKRRTNPKSVI